MTTEPRDKIDIKLIRQRLGSPWGKPHPLGCDAWIIDAHEMRIIVSIDEDSEPGTDWIHASIAHREHYRMPSYSEMKQMHQAVFGGGYAYQVFTAPDDHININNRVLHLWGRYDGKPALPDFGRFGTI